MARNMVFEPCTLVYTLLDPEFCFDDFSLIVRSLHNYMVDSIVPHPDSLSIHVKLQYQASVANAIAKLGSLQSTIAVTKLNGMIKENEYSRLEQLRRQYGLGCVESAAPQPMVRATRGRGRPRQQPARFPPAATRYQPYATRPSPIPIQQTITDYYPSEEAVSEEQQPVYDPTTGEQI